ncbi:hypothetical protein OG984_05770 [Nocardioides sp. NBC_00368]|uniref:hypothetical protein n=1 Tax=Nocardioides sp. NBC_00368 TaxID=2976000 RepID=UPI002E21D22A
MSEEPAPRADDNRTESELDRLSRLRAEVAALESQMGLAAEPSAATPGPTRRGGWWRGVVVTLCLTLLALLCPLAVVATWARDEVGDTDRYVATVTPLASDPAMQKAIANRITEELTTRVDIRQIIMRIVEALRQGGLGPQAADGLETLSTPLANAADDFIADQVDKVVRSDAFAVAWDEANREAHAQMVALLTGKESAVRLEGNAVTIDLAAFIEVIKERLIEQGFGLAARIPEINASFTVFESDQLPRAQSGFQLLTALARALPIAALVLLGTALVISTRKRRTLLAAALVVAGSMLVLGLALNGFRAFYLNAVSAEGLSIDAAAVFYDTVVRFIRFNLRAVLVISLAVALVAWVSGPSASALGLRRGASRTLAVVRTRSDSAGLGTGPVGAFLGRHRTAIRVLIAGLAVVTYALADRPTGAWTLTLVLIAGVVLLVVEVLARQPVHGETTEAEVR